MSCGVPTSLGTCSPIPAGVQPRAASDCVKETVSNCGLDGLCDGDGKCERYPTGTICSAGMCDADGASISNTYQCDGQGGCKLGASTVCAPFACDGSTSACFGKCTIDTDCASGRKCVAGSCGPKPLAAPCAANEECESGHCTDGVCCNAACDGACRTCKLVDHEGACSPTPEGQTHPKCNQDDPSTCGSAGVCDGLGACAPYPADTVCGAATCSGNTVETAQTCDGNGTCSPPEAQDCTPYRCSDGACTSVCKTDGDCADGHACVSGSCGPKQDGQACQADAECLNAHCVDGVCCENACEGACRSCKQPNMAGKCTLVASGATDPRATCTDSGASSCGTDGKCDGAGGCRKYAVNTVCAGELCASDVYTAPSTCNASGQCIKPMATPCGTYHCNGSKCYGSCTNNNQCVSPNICGQNGLNQCGPKGNGLACSSDSECGSGHCAQGNCCDKACTDACKACNLNGSLGRCSDVQSGSDPQGKCATQAQSTCGTTGACAAGQCAKFSSSTVCKAASCVTGGPPDPAVKPQSKCDGNGTCVTPGNVNCAPGRCDTKALMCVNTCTTNADCTAPNTCVKGSCGLIGIGGTCSSTNQCVSGLTCNHDKVCCNKSCDGVCETCKPPGGSAGTCTTVTAGQPDPSLMCQTTASSTCGTNGKCSGNNTPTGTARCQDYDGSTACGTQSCTNGATATAASTLKLVSTCSGSGACNTAPTQSCGAYKCLNATQCGSSCNTDSDCVGVTCDTVTHKCGTKQAQGQMCNVAADCVATAPNCVDGVCCNTACTGACQACNLGGNLNGTCSPVTAGTSDSGCLPAAAAGMCGNTGMCGGGGTCAKRGSETTCRGASCSSDNLSSVAATTCDGKADTCPPAPGGTVCGAAKCTGGGTSYSQTTAAMCSGAGVCSAPVTTPCGDFTCSGALCRTSCTMDSDCANGKGCNTMTGKCTGWVAGHACTGTGNNCGANLMCVDGVCCTSACTGACMTCDGTGACKPVTSGKDAACTNPNNDPCGNTGTCGPSGCAKADSNQACGQASCMGSTLKPAGMCDGAGMCMQPAGAPCPNSYACDAANNCYMTCIKADMSLDDTRCATGTTCQADGSCA